jgi:hypothetical protein
MRGERKRFYLQVLVAVLVLGLGACRGIATLGVTVGNPDWKIIISPYGYSDLLLDCRPEFENREFLSGEWAAAVCFTKGGGDERSDLA